MLSQTSYLFRREFGNTMLKNDMEKGSDEEVQLVFQWSGAGVRHFDNIGNINNGMRLLI